MPSCVMKRCTNNSCTQKKHSGITFHRFPCKLSLKEKWITAVRKNRNDVKWLPSKFSVICSSHFEESDYFNTKAGYRLLKPNTIPKKVSTPKLQSISKVPNETNQLPLMMLKVEPISMNNELTDPLTNEPTDPITNESTDPITNEPTDPITNEPTDPITNEPTDPITNEPTDPITNEPTDPITNEPTDPITNEPKNAITNKAPNPKRHRRRGPPVPNAATNLQESITILNNTLTREKTEDDCDIYAKLLATKLRRYPEDERTRMMYQIDGLLLSQPPTRPKKPSVFKEHCNRPNNLEADNNQPSSSTHRPQNNINSISRYEQASSTVDRSEAEESVLSTATCDTESISIKFELEDVMEIEIGEEMLI